MIFDLFKKTKYHSRFGGLWTDRRDAEAEAQRRFDAGELSALQRDLALQFIREGYVILRGALPAATLDAVDEALARVRRNPFVHLMGNYETRYAHATPSSWFRRDFRGPDFHVNSPAIRDAIFHPVITDFLRMVFADDVLGGQTLFFQYGSQQEIHQDPAYVTLDSPLRMAASWIALEDIEEGCGELIFYPGSHRFQDFLFSGKHKAFDVGRDGVTQHEAFIRSLSENAERQNLPLRHFTAKRGDVLIWSADLAHGGAPITRPDASRNSLVTHYNPLSVRPSFMKGEFKEVRRHSEGCYYSSAYYRVNDPVDGQGFMKPASAVNLNEWTSPEGCVLDLIARHGTEIQVRPGELTIIANDEDPGFFVEPQDLIRSDRISVKCEIESPAETVFQVFYWDADLRRYTEEKSVKVPVKHGSNRIELQIEGLSGDKRLRVDPGFCKGRFTLRSLEISDAERA